MGLFLFDAEGEDLESMAVERGLGMNDRERLVRLETLVEQLQTTIDTLVSKIDQLAGVKPRLDAQTRMMWLIAGAVASGSVGYFLSFIFRGGLIVGGGGSP